MLNIKILKNKKNFKTNFLKKSKNIEKILRCTDDCEKGTEWVIIGLGFDGITAFWFWGSIVFMP